jgi:hypothetical protein
VLCCVVDWTGLLVADVIFEDPGRRIVVVLVVVVIVSWKAQLCTVFGFARTVVGASSCFLESQVSLVSCLSDTDGKTS